MLVERTGCGSPNNGKDVSLVPILLVRQRRRDVYRRAYPHMFFVPVVDQNQIPLMPTTANRAARWIASRKATPFWNRGIFCVRLNVVSSGRNLQILALGIDPGSKKEGY